jgi:hypothetical protein
MVAMGVMNALIDVNVQLAVNNMTDKTDINWASVGVSFVTGMIGFGLVQKAAQATQAIQAGQKVTQAGARLLTLWRFLHFSFMHFLDLRSRKALTVLAFIQNSSKNLHELLPPKKAQSQQPRLVLRR